MSDYFLTADDLATIAQQLDEDAAEVFRTDYSGRGMYGRECIGYTGDYPTLAALEIGSRLAWHEAADAEDLYEIREALALLGEPAVDSMGTRTITYWPNLAYTAGDAPGGVMTCPPDTTLDDLAQWSGSRPTPGETRSAN